MHLKSGMVAVVGRANVGKSTLVNRLVGEKVSIVSDIEQTTRLPVRAILNEPRGQLVLLDTPGVHKAPRDLGRIMNRSARKSIEGVDAVLLLMDASERLRDEDRGWLSRMARGDVPGLVFINKKDAGDRHRKAIDAAWAACREEHPGGPPVAFLQGSAATGDGVKALQDMLFDLLPEGPALFPDDVLTDFPRKLAVADIIREKFFCRLHDEVPHHVAVIVDDIADLGDRWMVQAKVLVQRNSQRGILIGHKGRGLRAVKRAAAKEIQVQFGVDVVFDIHIRVEKNWDRNVWLLKQMGHIQ